MDQTDAKIITILKENSKLSHKEISHRVHLTGQAIGQRIAKLEEQGVIDKFTISVNSLHQQFILIYMDSNRFNEFEAFIRHYPGVEYFYKTSGHACYVLETHLNHTELEIFLEHLSKWGRYNVETVLRNIGTK